LAKYVFSGCLIFLFLIGFSSPGVARENAPLFYSFSRENNQLWLLGSVHLGDQSMYPMDTMVIQAWDSSDELVLELDLDNISPKLMMRWIVDKGMYPEGESLEQDISDTLLGRLNAVLAKMGVQSNRFQNFRPWMICIQLSGSMMEQQGLAKEWGVDYRFMKLARAEGRPLVALETHEEQLGSLESLSLVDPAAVLEWCVDDAEEMLRTPHKLIDCWKTGDAECLSELVLEGPLENPEMKFVREAFFDDRNKRMVHRLNGLVKKHRNYFMVVGTGHLLGEQGIVNLLRQTGWRLQDQVSSPVSAGGSEIR